MLGAFVQDMSRNCYFSYSHDDDSYKHYTTKVYAIEKSLMYNMTKSETNAKFDTYIDGTSNMTSTLLAPAFVAKGHYYDLSEVVEGKGLKEERGETGRRRSDRTSGGRPSAPGGKDEIGGVLFA